MPLLEPLRLGLDRLRLAVVVLCVVATWVYIPGGAYLDTLQQLQSLLLLSLAAVLLGFRALTPRVVIVWLLGLALMLLNGHTVYWGASLSGVAGLLLLGIAAHTGGAVRQRPECLPWLLMAIVAAALVNAVEGLLQWLGLADALWQWMIVTEHRGMAFGTLRQFNLFATFVNVGLVCVLWLVHLRRLTEAMAWVLMTLMVWAVAASGSRTGGLEIMALSLWGLWLARHQPAVLTRLMLGATLMLGLAWWALPSIAQWHDFGFATAADRATYSAGDSRWLLWRNVLELIRLQPWTGWGWQELVYAHYITPMTPKFPGSVDHAHNLLLQLAVEFGLPVALACCALLLWGVIGGRPWLRIDSRGQHPPSAEAQQVYPWMILLFIVGLHSMLEFPLWYACFLFLAGWAAGYLLPTAPAQGSRYAVWAVRGVWAATLSLWVLMAITWQQYGDLIKVGQAPFNDRAAQRATLKYGAHAAFFRNTVDLATLRLTDISPANAAATQQLAQRLLHYSPTPQVLESLLQSLWLQGDIAALQKHAALYCAQYPESYVKWAQLYADPALLTAAGFAPSHCVINP